MRLAIDHIVYIVPDFESALDDLEGKLGVRPQVGGRHLSRGTKNALLNLGNECYLEVLAADPENTTFLGERWMGVDLIKKPTISRWAIQSANIEHDCQVLKKYHPNLGEIAAGERKTQEGDILRWKMSLPLALPQIEIVPFLLDWSTSAYHPTKKLEEACKLLEIKFFHPQPEIVNPIFQQLNLPYIVGSSGNAKIEVHIQGRKHIDPIVIT